jgi:hypothetical protein
MCLIVTIAVAEAASSDSVSAPVLLPDRRQGVTVLILLYLRGLPAW